MPEKRGEFGLEEVLPRLVSAYENGRLVPFIGVGMSRPHCADWPGLISGLERAAAIVGLPELTKSTKSEDLIRRANDSVRKLRASAGGEFRRALEGALFTRSEPVPAQMAALARIWWPLVLTTNYDNFYVKAFDDAFGASGLAVVGRGSEHCQRVLSSLAIAGRALLWALQGHIATPARVDGRQDDDELASELVIDHTEYRRVTYREPHFRRAFAEVFRHRSFLFLGSGLRETYLQELFGEVLELYGPSARTHYAIMPREEVDPRFMLARFQIAVVEYDPGETSDHSFVRHALDQLRHAIDRPDAAPVSWTWGRVDQSGREASSSAPDLEVVRGPLPSERRDHECLAVSAGGQLDGPFFHVSKQMQPTLDAWCRRKPGESIQPTRISPFVGEYAGRDAFAVRARREHEDVKDLLAVRDASRALFDAVAPRYRCIRMQLLASGGADHASGEPRWSVRTFPTRYVFVETVRAWGEWRRTNPAVDCRLALHVVDPSVYREIASGRIDILELLGSEDIRFWAEVIEGGVLLERRQFHLHESTPLQAVADELGLPPPHWRFLVSPPTGIADNQRPRDLDAAEAGVKYTSRVLRELGVVPGSVLHFSRLDRTVTAS